MDLVVRCAKLPAAGETIMAESSAEFCGGKGANQAVAAALSGSEVSMIGAVGNDAFADRLMGNLAKHGVICRGVAQKAGQTSGLAIISVDQRGQNSIVVVPGANASISRDDVHAARSLIEQNDVMLVQLEIPVDAVLAGIEIAKLAGLRVVLDPAPAPTEFPPQLLAVDVVCPNESEAAALTGLPVDSIAGAGMAAAKLHQMGAQHVAITMGERGTLLHSDGESQLIPAFPVTAVDTTAAGDGFAGALATFWSQTGDLVESVRFANAAGGLAASKHGAQASMANRKSIESLLSAYPKRGLTLSGEAHE